VGLHVIYAHSDMMKKYCFHLRETLKTKIYTGFQKKMHNKLGLNFINEEYCLYLGNLMGMSEKVPTEELCRDQKWRLFLPGTLSGPV
jgi:hypothetical protein